MNYLSIGFAAFVAILLICYCLVPKRCRWHILLLGSLFFYLSFDVRYMLFLLFVSFTTYGCARYMEQMKRKKLVIGICIVINVGVWFVIKALPWWWGNFNRVLGMVGVKVEMPFSSLIVPIGISYYLLQAIGYVIDVYKNRISAENNYLKYLLFLAYFPAIVQGPISKYEQLNHQLTEAKRITFDAFRSNLLLILHGVIKKMVVADQIAVFANYCFGNYKDLEGVILYLGAVSYAIQLYTDFSGCVDICRGVSGLFGIELIDNFNAPYFAKSIKEFWGRWHISLSTWLKDYVYIPLGGNRKGKMRKYANLVITFLVSGVWHGEGFHYIVWGLLQTVYQIVGECTYELRRKIKRLIKVEENSLCDKVYRVCITFNLTVFSWIFFRSGGLTNAITYIKRMFRSMSLWTLFDGSFFEYGLNMLQTFVLLLNLIFVIVIDYMKKKKRIDVGAKIMKCHIVLRWAIYFILFFNVLLFGAYGNGYDMSGFLYGGF